MEKNNNSVTPAEKVNLLNTIINDLLLDASELIKDLYAGVRTYLIFGLISTLFGIAELLNNMDKLQERYYIPAFVAFCLIFCGVAQIIVYNRLRKKYAKLFEAGFENKIL